MKNFDIMSKHLLLIKTYCDAKPPANIYFYHGDLFPPDTRAFVAISDVLKRVRLPRQTRLQWTESFYGDDVWKLQT